MPSKLLPTGFYQRTDTQQIAQELLGKVLVTKFEGVVTAGKIVETEAYLGMEDRACHAYDGKRTPRTEIMYTPGGVAYIYLIYGMYHLFNVITHREGQPHAVLVRGIEPLEGIPTMLDRRKKTELTPKLTAGPGILSIALGLKKDQTGTPLTGETIGIEDWGFTIGADKIIASPRVGVDYAGDHAAWPLRFRVSNSPWTSPAK